MQKRQGSGLAGTGWEDIARFEEGLLAVLGHLSSGFCRLLSGPVRFHLSGLGQPAERDENAGAHIKVTQSQLPVVTGSHLLLQERTARKLVASQAQPIRMGS